jgi:hypothetical protein
MSYSRAPTAACGGAAIPPAHHRLQYALTLLLRPHTTQAQRSRRRHGSRHSAESRYGFRIRGALGDLLGLLVIALPQPEARSALGCRTCLDQTRARLHAERIVGPLPPLASCTRTSRTAAANSGQVQRLSEACRRRSGIHSPLANEHLSGTVAAILLPDRNLTLCRGRDGTSPASSSGVLAQMHRHFTTRAQLHGRTLVANHLALDGSDAAVPYKAISTPIRDEARRVAACLRCCVRQAKRFSATRCRSAGTAWRAKPRRSSVRASIP